jgi:hypothetical protein
MTNMPPKEEQNEEEPGFFARIKNFFSSSEEEDTHYDRRILDSRIERYLDNNFNSYIDEYGLIRELELRRYDERVDILEDKVDGLKDFVKDADADISELELRTEDIQDAAGKGSSKKK